MVDSTDPSVNMSMGKNQDNMPDILQKTSPDSTEGGRLPWAFAEAPARYVSVEGAEICYRLWRHAEAHKPTLLFLHGFRAHARWWDHIIPFFQDDYTIASMDFSGLGDSGWRKEYKSEIFAREVLAVIKDAALAPVTLIAHSFSGTPSLFACNLAPECIKRAILIDSRVFLQGVVYPVPVAGSELEVKPFSLGGERPGSPSLEALLERFRLLPPAEGVDPDLLKHIARHSAVRRENGWSWKFDPNLDPHMASDPGRAASPVLGTPLDYIYGDVSMVATREQVHEIVAKLPTCAAPIAIPKCNHHVLLEQPVALIAVLRTLLNPG